jgi:hypothetical protein
MGRESAAAGCSSNSNVSRPLIGFLVCACCIAATCCSRFRHPLKPPRHSGGPGPCTCAGAVQLLSSLPVGPLVAAPQLLAAVWEAGHLLGISAWIDHHSSTLRQAKQAAGLTQPLAPAQPRLPAAGPADASATSAARSAASAALAGALGLPATTQSSSSSQVTSSPAAAPAAAAGSQAATPVSGDASEVQAHAVIESIRRDEFGEGLHLEPEAAAVMARQRARLQRAVKRLAVDLYSEELHLLQELLQNADDCRWVAARDGCSAGRQQGGGMVKKLCVVLAGFMPAQLWHCRMVQRAAYQQPCRGALHMLTCDMSGACLAAFMACWSASCWLAVCQLTTRSAPRPLRYPDGVAPELALVASHAGLALASNEAGFSERDVRALCDVGASAKADAPEGGALQLLLCTGPWRCM